MAAAAAAAAAWFGNIIAILGGTGMGTGAAPAVLAGVGYAGVWWAANGVLEPIAKRKKPATYTCAGAHRQIRGKAARQGCRAAPGEWRRGYRGGRRLRTHRGR